QPLAACSVQDNESCSSAPFSRSRNGESRRRLRGREHRKGMGMLSRVATLVLVSVLFVGTASVAFAQDASPEAGRPPRDISLLKALGLPEISLVATDTDVTGLPQTVEA